ncbi:MAG: DUF1554 domain-containing protein [Leptospirales bacterium]|nr:DUF1554 domain-containing protein [Leptospirales bacterium]
MTQIQLNLISKSLEWFRTLRPALVAFGLGLLMMSCDNFPVSSQGLSQAAALVVYTNMAQPVSQTATSLPSLKLFVTTADNQPGVNFSGITQADSRCMSDPGYPGTGTYKALLVQPGVRVACSTANCSGGTSEHIDWVLQANRTYARTTGLTVLTTNADGIFVFGTLMNAVATGAAGWWTGLNSNWTFNSACTGNTWSSTGGNARYGDPNTTNASSIAAGVDGCTTTGSKLLCIQQ